MRRWTDKRTVEGDGPYKCGGGRRNGGSKRPPYECGEGRAALRLVNLNGAQEYRAVTERKRIMFARAEKTTEFAQGWEYDGDVMRI